MVNQSPTRSIDSKHSAIFVVAIGSAHGTRLECEHGNKRNYLSTTNCLLETLPNLSF